MFERVRSWGGVKRGIFVVKIERKSTHMSEQQGRSGRSKGGAAALISR